MGFLGDKWDIVLAGVLVAFALAFVFLYNQ
jgi:hypothetical protein